MEGSMHYRQHEEAKRRKRIADIQALMRLDGLPQKDELFAAWYVDEGRKDLHLDAWEVYRTPVGGISPKGREERQVRITNVTRQARTLLITDPWATNFATWYVDAGRADPLLNAWDEWRAARKAAVS